MIADIVMQFVGAGGVAGGASGLAYYMARCDRVTRAADKVRDHDAQVRDDHTLAAHLTASDCEFLLAAQPWDIDGHGLRNTTIVRAVRERAVELSERAERAARRGTIADAAKAVITDGNIRGGALVRGAGNTRVPGEAAREAAANFARTVRRVYGRVADTGVVGEDTGGEHRDANRDVDFHTQLLRNLIRGDGQLIDRQRTYVEALRPDRERQHDGYTVGLGNWDGIPTGTRVYVRPGELVEEAAERRRQYLADAARARRAGFRRDNPLEAVGERPEPALEAGSVGDLPDDPRPGRVPSVLPAERGREPGEHPARRGPEGSRWVRDTATFHRFDGTPVRVVSEFDDGSMILHDA